MNVKYIKYYTIYRKLLNLTQQYRVNLNNRMTCHAFDTKINTMKLSILSELYYIINLM